MRGGDVLDIIAAGQPDPLSEVHLEGGDDGGDGGDDGGDDGDDGDGDGGDVHDDESDRGVGEPALLDEAVIHQDLHQGEVGAGGEEREEDRKEKGEIEDLLNLLSIT